VYKSGVDARRARYVTLRSGTTSLTRIAAEFQRFIGTSIPQIIDLLHDDNNDIRTEGAKLMLTLSAQGIEHIRSDQVSLMSIAAEFQWFIVTCIPQIIDLLEDSSSNVRKEGTKLLTILSEQGV
jgi:hypothetical protein